jgi:hypothetical protein
MVSKNLALKGVLSSGDELFNSAIKVTSLLQGELHDLKERLTLIDDKSKTEKAVFIIDETIGELGTQRKKLKDFENSFGREVRKVEDVSVLMRIEKDCETLIGEIPDFKGFSEFFLVSGNVTDEVAVFEQHRKTIVQILSGIIEISRLFRYVNKADAM